MTRHPLFGLLLAAFGALILTPDTLFMRLSGMDGFAMLGWRGLLTGLVLIVSWPLTTGLIMGRRPGALASLWQPAALGVIIGHATNTTLFALGVAVAPVAIVLLSVATIPIFAAIFGRLLLGERTSGATWVTMALVLSGIAIAVLGHDAAGQGGNALLGVAAGLGVAIVMSLNFVIIRQAHDLPIQPTMGMGSLLAGLIGLSVTGGPGMMEGQVWAIAVVGLVILPLSFLSLSVATRHTSATNVSLLMLLETVLGPVWVWIGVHEPMTPAMILGGALVVVSLAVYIILEGRRAR
mgnify:CR=1 FL=1